MANNFQINLTDNSAAALQAIKDSIVVGLEKVGIECRDNAKIEITNAGVVDTGTLRNSITYKVIDYEVYTGSNLFYAPYVCHGTGRFADNGQGRPGWWVFIKGKHNEPSDEPRPTYTKEQALKIYHALVAKALKGEADYSPDDVWITQGQKPTHFLQKAIEDHMEEYRQIIKDSFVF